MQIVMLHYRQLLNEVFDVNYLFGTCKCVMRLLLVMLSWKVVVWYL